MAEQNDPSNRRSRAATRHMQGVGERKEDNSWLLVYLDVITLLLIVFIVLYALMDPGDHEDPSEGILDGAPDILEDDPSVLEGEPDLLDEPAEAADVPEELLEEHGITATGEEETLTFRLDDAVLFDTAEAELRDAGREAIDEILPVLEATGARISVEGHTDDRPIATEQFPSNWELSSARASAVLRYLEEQGIERARMRAIGYGDIRPLADNDTPEGRAENRRVEVTLHFGADRPPEDLPMP